MGGPPESREQPRAYTFHAIKLKAQDIEYDGFGIVTFYINRLDYMAQTYGEDTVLSVLPIAMKGEARTWFDSVLLGTRMAMNQSLDLWTTKLMVRFRNNSSTALQEVDIMKHTFDDESKLTVRKYLTAKQALYIEAGEENEDLIVRRLHEGFDPTLKLAITLNKYNTLDQFTVKVYSAKSAARDQHNAYFQMFARHDENRRRENQANRDDRNRRQ